MAKAIKKYYIKQRLNPQTGVYYVPMGLLSKRQAAAAERSLYGSNVMLGYPTEAGYLMELERLREKGEKVL